VSSEWIIYEVKKVQKKTFVALNLPGWLRKSKKNSFNMAGVLVEILSRHFLSTGLEDFCYLILVGPT
jgi:hypothetical protein